MSQAQLFDTQRAPARPPKPSMFPCDECGSGFDVHLAVDVNTPGWVAAWMCDGCMERLGWILYDPRKAVLPL